MDMSLPKRLSDGQKRRIMIGVMMAMTLAAIDQTIVAPALPIMGASLGDSEFLSWIISAYLVTGRVANHQGILSSGQCHGAIAIDLALGDTEC